MHQAGLNVFQTIIGASCSSQRVLLNLSFIGRTVFDNILKKSSSSDAHVKNDTKELHGVLVEVHPALPQPAASQDVVNATDVETLNVISQDVIVYTNFVTEDEERSLVEEVEPYLKRLKYETDHWDDVSRFNI